jgi:hypothetical protein
MRTVGDPIGVECKGHKFGRPVDVEVEADGRDGGPGADDDRGAIVDALTVREDAKLGSL